MAGKNLSDSSEGLPIGSVYAFLRERPSYRRKLVTLPPVVVLGAFFFAPLVIMLYYSLRTGTTGSASFTIANYATIAQSVYGVVIWRTTVLTVQTTVIVTLVGYTLAYSTVRFTKRTTLVLLLVILPFWTNYIIRMYAWMNILQHGGALGSMLQAMNLVQEPVGFLYTGNAVLIGFSYIWLPLAVLPFYATLSDLEEDLIEAAKDLGSGPIKTFFSVTLPLTKGGLIAGIILVAIPKFGSFITPALLGGTNVTMVGMLIESQFNQAFNWSFGSALGIFVSALVVVLLLIGILLGGSGFFGSGDVE